MVNWVYGSGFPKSLDVSKAIDKMHGAERERELDAFFTKQVLATHVAQAGQNLRDISTLYYGRPENWPDIADFNGLAGSLTTPGKLLRIPKLT
jgi:nucleoid-associated protein YgaU